MTRKVPTRAVWLLAAYGAYLLAPLVHRLVESEVRPCAQCEAAVQNGWVLQANCDGPCSDPTHHHHHRPSGHDPRHCIFCHSHPGVHPVSAATEIADAYRTVSRLTVPNEAGFPTAYDGNIDSIRAPPHTDSLA